MRRIARPFVLVLGCSLALVVSALGKTEERSPETRVITMEVTAYCPCKKCCGPKAQGITASGRRVSHNDGLFVAADTRLLPFHTKLLIPGYANGSAVQSAEQPLFEAYFAGQRSDDVFAEMERVSQEILAKN